MRHTPTRLVPIAALFCLFAATAVPAGDFDDAALMKVHHPDWFKDGFLDLEDDLAEALAQGKRGLMVFFTTDGCSYCAEFTRSSLGDPRIAARVQDHFDAVGLEIFSDAEMTDPKGESLPVKAFAEREGAGFAPTLLFYGDEGRLLYRGVGYHTPERFEVVLDFLAGEHDREGTFRDYVAGLAAAGAPHRSSYRLAPDPLFAIPPYALDRTRFAAERPLLVLFEADGCSECAALHREVLALAEVREIMDQFEVVRLDARDTGTPVLAPDGSRTTPADWYAASGLAHLPALLFFDEGGKEVLRTDALVLRQRMMNSLRYTLERAYEKEWTYQRFARSKALERMSR